MKNHFKAIVKKATAPSWTPEYRKVVQPESSLCIEGIEEAIESVQRTRNVKRACFLDPEFEKQINGFLINNFMHGFGKADSVEVFFVPPSYEHSTGIFYYLAKSKNHVFLVRIKGERSALCQTLKEECEKALKKTRG
ncbi:MAG: hypothetical protein ABIA76_05160 [Candidatus Diapherotrites archaeon]